MKVRDILAKINQVAPVELAEEWDNVGLMVGDLRCEIRRLGLSLDPLPEALEEAFRKGCQGVLSHHPLFFKPMRHVDLASNVGKAIHMAIKTDMTVLAAHTNWDNAESGVNRILAKKLDLVAVAPLVQIKESAEKGAGMGAVGELPAESPIRDVLDRLKRAWNLTRLDYYGPVDCSILRVGLCGGSGGSLWPAALAMKADLYVTADMKYHDILDCTRSKLPIAVADHAEMERVTLAELARYLATPGELEVLLLDYKALETPLHI
jgi:dinuclear metal center YbgI/SA1388 family protein